MSTEVRTFSNVRLSRAAGAHMYTVAKQLFFSLSSFIKERPLHVAFFAWFLLAGWAFASGGAMLSLIVAGVVWAFAALISYRQFFSPVSGVCVRRDARFLLALVVLICVGVLHGAVRYAWFGIGLEATTIIAVATMIVAAWVTGRLCATRELTESDVWQSVSAAAVVLGVFSLFAHVFFGNSVADVWGLFVLGMLGALACIDSPSIVVRIAARVGLSFSCAWLTVGAPVWVALCVGVVMIAVSASRLSTHRFAALAGVTLVMLALVAPTHLFRSTAPEVRARVGDVVQAMSFAYDGRPHVFALGTGPMTFESTWNQYRPVDVNVGVLWDRAQVLPPNTLTRIVVEYGVPAALFVVLALLFWGVRSAARKKENGTFFALCGVLLVVPMPTAAFPLWVMCVVVASALVCSETTTDISAVESEALRRVLREGSMGVAVVALFVSAGLLQQALALHYFARAQALVRPEAISQAMEYYERSIALVPLPNVLAEYADMYTNAARALLETNPQPTGDRLDQLVGFLDTAETAVSQAREKEPRSLDRELAYAHTLFLRSVLLRDREPRDVYEAYGYAATVAPQHPVPYVFLANAEVTFGDTAEAKRTLYRALTLAPGLAEAEALMRRIAASEEAQR